MERKRGRARKEERQGEVVSRERLSRVCSARLKEEGVVNSSASLESC